LNYSKIFVFFLFNNSFDLQEQIEDLKEKLKEANLLLKEKDEKKDDEVKKIQEKYDK
jgi:hypothetical protein